MRQSIRTPADVLSTRAAADAGRPLITYRTPDARIELSVATTANWVAKAANLLRDGLGAEPGARLGLALPPHWQTAVLALAGWAAGLVVVSGTTEDCDVVAVPAEQASRTADIAADEILVLALDPMGLRVRTPLPVGVTDFGGDVLSYGDRFVSPLLTLDAAALVQSDRRWTAAELIADAGSRAEVRRLTADDRVLVSGLDLLDDLLTPLVAGACLVLVPDLAYAADQRMRTEEGITAADR